MQTPNPFTIELGDDWQINLGESISLNPFFSEPADNYLWSPADLIDCDLDCETLDFTPTQSALYSLTATSLSGCLATDSIFVEVATVRQVYIPNSFSPNFDGINDFFTIYGAIPNVQQIEELIIFDRWGGVVFEQKGFLPNDESAGWDGTKRKKSLDTGTYAYLAKIRFLDQVVVLYEGDVILIK
ncbi:MAG: gliding motility-associated C-terminal domain-containing protein [Saprospiraceae bacterium]